MTVKQAEKMLRTEKEIVSMDRDSHALFASLALNMLYAGKTVKAKLVAGPWNNGPKVSPKLLKLAATDKHFD